MVVVVGDGGGGGSAVRCAGIGSSGPFSPYTDPRR